MRALTIVTLMFLVTLPASSLGAKGTAYDPDRTPYSVPAITGGVTVDGAVDRREWAGALAIKLSY